MAIYVNGLKIPTSNFPSGECNIKLPDKIKNYVRVVAYIICSDDILGLFLTIDAIRRMNTQAEIELILPYLPYARQDKIKQKGDPLGVEVIAKILNSLNCKKVKIYDPHSNKISNLIHNCQIIEMHDIVLNSKVKNFIIDNSLLLASPDKGAKPKVIKLASKLLEQKNIVNCIFARKKRDVETNKIFLIEIEGDPANKDILVLDDICDSGQTAIKFAIELKKHGARNLYLYITHGVFSKGINKLADYYQHIFCFHSIFDPKIKNSNLITILSNFR